VGFRRRRWRDVRPEEEKVRVNKAIRIAEVRVINEDGQQLGVMSTDAARDVAQRVGLDLVEISPNSRPPVCKIMDYGRYKYEAKKKESERRKAQHQSQMKEIKLRPRIGDHDLELKLRKAREFLFEGDKVKWNLMFRGRERQNPGLGMDLLNRITKILEEVATVEQRPRLEGRLMTQTMAPNRAGIQKIKASEAERAKAEEAAEAGGEPEAEARPEETAAGEAEGAAAADS
jgi:translation initiation factor IF-3